MRRSPPRFVAPAVSSINTSRTGLSRHSGRLAFDAAAVSKARLVITAVVVEGRRPAEVAVCYRVARSWVYDLVARYQEEGEAAFEPRSRRPPARPRRRRCRPRRPGPGRAGRRPHSPAGRAPGSGAGSRPRSTARRRPVPGPGSGPGSWSPWALSPLFPTVSSQPRTKLRSGPLSVASRVAASRRWCYFCGAV
jgi:hypothetical protein